MNKTEILDIKTTILSNIHHNREYHRLAMGSVVKEFGKIILNATLEFDAVNAFATLQDAHNRVKSDSAHFFHQLFGFANVNKSAGDNIGA